ncbi:MAG: transcription-repair coupling factor [Chloroflexi bacterium]|nr:transcription-repair coupling factor [Chloroflexota bacterium]
MARVSSSQTSDHRTDTLRGGAVRLNHLLPAIRRDPGYAELREWASTAGSRNRGAHSSAQRGQPHRFSVLDAAKPGLLAALHAELGRPTILLVSRGARARQLAEELAAWAEEPDSVLLFPELDALPYERMLPGVEHMDDRLRAMRALATSPQPPNPGRQIPAPIPPLVVVTARAAMDRIMAAETFQSAARRLRVGDPVRPDQLVAVWLRAGYAPVSVVEGPGELARRGGIIDVWPIGVRPDASWRSVRPTPVRIELWGNEIASLRAFDPATQRSTQSVDEIVVGPAHEVLPDLSPEAHAALEAMDLRRLRPRALEEVEGELRLVRDGQAFPLLGWYRGLLGQASILDYLPTDGLLVLDEPGAIAATARELHRQAEELRIDLFDRGEAPGNPPRPYWSWEELVETARLGGRGTTVVKNASPPLRLDLVLDAEVLDTGFVPAPSYSGRLPDLIGGEGLVIVSQQASRLADLFAERGVDLPQSPVLLVHGTLGEGWSNAAIDLVVLTDRELFGWAKVRRAGQRLSTAARERFLSDLEIGELVVHIDHGVGRYHGLVTIADRATGIEREYLDIEYAENSRLRVLAEHADRVSRYIGSGEAVPNLTKLGTGEWQRAKQRIRSAVRRIAKELVELYASRELAEAPPLGPDTQWQMELEAAFPFLETPDQLASTREVKDDLEQPRPMDRLLVGDVGYGKTEVALRASFKAVSYEKQVAVLVPTTVLAQQHFTTFRERLAPFPLRVEMLSRFLSDREARSVVSGLKNGTVEIVIGTHRLLQKDVEFKNLGLVIIDEEQRFGVVHKERFKQLRTEIHVLSLSATPIPRTLHLSLVGVRDLSMMQTPPEERLPIRTYVNEHDDGLVREAILRELDRGGQVYYVSNRVYSIYTVAARLSALVPEARIAVGHGQMSDDELEDAMLRFANGDADVLVCTTIIEAGLDLPNVNTIVVTNAHQFGLSQLYQLRGRVGRGSSRAYAYFLYPSDRQISEVAEKRLRAIFEATELGAGYRIALKDLEIRGAGNLLGVEQHGHISAVGFELYCRLLGEAVEQLKALREQTLGADGATMVTEPAAALQGWLAETPSVSVELPLSASLPAQYVADEAARLSLYQRLAAVRDGPALGELMSEVEDRFGPLPEPAVNLFYLLSLRLTAMRAGVEEIQVDDSEIVVRFPFARSVDGGALGRAAGLPIGVRANQVRMPLGRGAAWMPALRNLVDELAASR